MTATTLPSASSRFASSWTSWTSVTFRATSLIVASTLKRVVPDDDVRRQAVLVDERDPRLRVRVAGDEPEQRRDHDRVGEQHAEQHRRAQQRAHVLAQDQENGPHVSSPFDELERPVGKAGELFPVVGRDEHRAAVLGDRPRDPPHALALRRVERRRSARRAAAPAATPSSASATSSRCRLPTESEPARVSAGSSKAAASSSAPLRGTRSSAREQARGSRAPSAARSAPRAAAPSRRDRGRSTVPAVGSSAPARIASSVDLPAPFGPTSATTSPATRSRSVGSSATRDPKRRATPRAVRRVIPGARRGGGPARSTSAGSSRRPRLELDAVGEELPHRAARRRAAAARSARRAGRRSPCRRASPKITSSGCSRSALPITFGTTMCPSTWWMPRKSSATQSAEIGCTTSA